jgi:hypothetical protein
MRTGLAWKVVDHQHTGPGTGEHSEHIMISHASHASCTDRHQPGSKSPLPTGNRTPTSKSTSFQARESIPSDDTAGISKIAIDP